MINEPLPEPGHIDQDEIRFLQPAPRWILAAIKKCEQIKNIDGIYITADAAYNDKELYFLTVLECGEQCLEEDTIELSPGDRIIAYDHFGEPTFPYKGYICTLLKKSSVVAKLIDDTYTVLNTTEEEEEPSENTSMDDIIFFDG